jgi:branched-chain amino acid transport system permease protein
MLWVYFGVGPWLGVVPAVAVAALAGSAIAWLGFRFSIEGVYFALLTIAFAEFTRIAFDHIGAAGGAGGFFIPYQAQRLGEWWNLRGGQRLFYYVGLALATGGVILTAWLEGSRLGYQWRAVREDQQAARALGIDVLAAKMKAALISSAMTAVGGVFYAFYYDSLFPAQVFGIGRSIELILAPIVGGLGTVFGPVVGAFILTPLGELLAAVVEKLGVDAPGAKALFYGLTLMAIIFLRPDGVWPWLARICGLAGRRPGGSS